MPPTTTGRLLVKDRQGLRDQPAGCRETLGGPYPRMSARQRRTLGDAGPPGSTGVSAPPAPYSPSGTLSASSPAAIRSAVRR